MKFLKDLLVGDKSKKRAITALYVAIRGAYEALFVNGFPLPVWPGYIDTLAGSFGIWAFGDAINKIGKK